MKAINISAAEMANIKELPSDWTIISINEEYGDLYPINLTTNNKVLRLRFTDTDEGGVVKNGVSLRTINENEAKEIINFIKENTYKNYLIHCFAGISRSSAVAAFLHIAFGYGLKDNYWQTSMPNLTVLKFLVREYYSNNKEYGK